MRKEKNPFEIFGLLPQVVKETDENTLFKLIKTMYKIFQMTYHPDKGGNPKKALEINLAFEKLNLEKNPESFNFYRNKYIKRLSKKTLKTELEELKNQNRKLSFYNQLLKEKFWQYLETNLNYFNNCLQENHNLALKLFDIVSYMNFSGIRNTKKQMFFKDLIITQKFILKRMNYEEYFRIFINYKYIGCIRRENLEPWFLLEKELEGENQKFKNFISKEVFIRECLVYLEPKIKNNSYIFFYSPENFNKVILEGVVISFKEMEEGEFLEIIKNKVINFEKKIETKIETLNNLSSEIVEF